MPEFEIDKSEVLRYAGHKDRQVPESLNRLADEVINRCISAVTPRHITRRCKITQVENGVMLEGGLVLQGDDIKKHLDGCDECYMLCATVGTATDSFIRTMQAMGSVHGLLADAAGSAAIESYCDRIETDLRNSLKTEGKFLTWRYSPGYGDFPFTQQPELLAFLQAAKFAGVTCNESAVMIPTKSVTAVMGIASHKPRDRQGKCAVCSNRNNCNFSCR